MAYINSAHWRWRVKADKQNIMLLWFEKATYYCLLPMTYWSSTLRTIVASHVIIICNYCSSRSFWLIILYNALWKSLLVSPQLLPWPHQSSHTPDRPQCFIAPIKWWIHKIDHQNFLQQHVSWITLHTTPAWIITAI